MARVTTFYSYKGGSGRSMAMANVAWALATNGERVLAIDWDLEAPGLHRYFHPFLSDPEQASSTGLVDRIWSYIDALGEEGASKRDTGSRFRFADCDEIVQPLDLPIRSKGCLHLLGAGRQDDQYSEKVGGLDWAGFYARFDGEAFIDRLLAWARGKYTHVLIDSRTGVADTAGICTAQVPDAVVICLVYNRQSIDGSAAIARSILKTREERGQHPLSIRVIPCRVEERGVVESARRHAASRLAKALGQDRPLIERSLRRDEVRHYPWCAFEEKLAVFEDVPDERGSLLDAMHELARRLTDRKRLKIAEIDPDVLASIWRRAAFDDPRMADLEALQEAPLEEARHQLYQWLDEALVQREQRPDWLMALAEAALSHAGARDDRLASLDNDFFGSAGLRLGNRAFDADPEQYRIRFALLLQSRSVQLQKLSLYEEGLALAEQSHRLFAEDGHPVSRWRGARSLERIAELRWAMGDAEGAIAVYRAAVNAYSSIGRRDMPLGVALDPARVMRVLAERLVEQGDLVEADHMAEAAVRQLQRTGGRSHRDAAEVANILATRAEVAALMGSDDAHRQIIKVRMFAKDVLDSPIARAQFERRLALAEARLHARKGNTDHALELLARAGWSEQASPGGAGDIVELQAEILLDAGREDEAADLLIAAIENEHVAIGARFAELLRRALAASGRQPEVMPLLLSRLIANDRGSDPAAILQWLAEQKPPVFAEGQWKLPSSTSFHLLPHRPGTKR